jgi:hypothetical protein
MVGTVKWRGAVVPRRRSSEGSEGMVKEWRGDDWRDGGRIWSGGRIRIWRDGEVVCGGKVKE